MQIKAYHFLFYPTTERTDYFFYSSIYFRIEKKVCFLFFRIKKKKPSICSIFTTGQIFYYDFFLPAPWNALKSKCSAQSLTEQFRSPSKAEYSRTTSLFLQISCHVGMRKQAYIFFTAVWPIWLLQKSQDFVRASKTTSCSFFLVFAGDCSTQSWNSLIKQHEKHRIQILLIQPLSIFSSVIQYGLHFGTCKFCIFSVASSRPLMTDRPCMVPLPTPLHRPWATTHYAKTSAPIL